MSDERGRGAADDGPPKSPDEETEPEFGSSDWLLQQLTGGRHVERPAESPTVASPVAEPADEDIALPVEASAPVPAAEPVPGRFDDLLKSEDETPAAEEVPVGIPGRILVEPHPWRGRGSPGRAGARAAVGSSDAARPVRAG